MFAAEHDVSRKQMSVTARDTAFARVPTGTLLLAFGGWIVASIVTSSEPRSCFGAGLEGPAYPVLPVVVSSVLIAVEVLVLWRILCSAGTVPPWQRMMRSLAVTAPPAVSGFLFLMHIAPYFSLHVWWLGIVSGLLILMILMEGAVQAVTRVLARSYGSGQSKLN
jgi:hypothetical protein